MTWYCQWRAQFKPSVMLKEEKKRKEGLLPLLYSCVSFCQIAPLSITAMRFTRDVCQHLLLSTTEECSAVWMPHSFPTDDTWLFPLWTLVPFRPEQWDHKILHCQRPSPMCEWGGVVLKDKRFGLNRLAFPKYLSVLSSLLETLFSRGSRLRKLILEMGYKTEPLESILELSCSLVWKLLLVIS